MKKICILLTLVLAFPVLTLAQGWPANYGGVMLQGFFWDSYNPKPDSSPWGPPGYRQENEATALDKGDDWTWATIYGAGWSEGEEWQVPVSKWYRFVQPDVMNMVTPYIDLLWLPQSGSSVAPQTQIYYTSKDDSGRGGNRAWRKGYRWGYSDGTEITNPDCMGFVPVFYFHHGMTYVDGQGNDHAAEGTPWTYDYNGTIYTPFSYFGDENQLKYLISTYKAAGTGCVEDVVANHRGGLGTWGNDAFSFDFPQEYYPDLTTGQNDYIQWSIQDVCRDDEAFWKAGSSHIGEGENAGDFDCGGDAGKGQWARDIDHHTAATQAKVVKYLRYMRENLGYVGFRYDYARGFEPIHFGEYNVATRPTFSVGEFWGSYDEITNWIKGTYYEGAYQSAAFDFPLMSAINNAFNNGYYRGLKGAGLIGNSKFRRYAVTFVDNHDTFKDLPTDGSNYEFANRTNYHIVEANCFILAMPGTPCLFWPHFMHEDWHDIICTFIKARRTAGVNNESDAIASEWGGDGVAWRINGEHGDLFLQLGNGIDNEAIPEGFSEVWKSDICRLSITSSLADQVENNQKTNRIYGYPVIDKNSGAYNSSVDVTIKASDADTRLVYTTNGVSPHVAAPQDTMHVAENTIKHLTFRETTMLKVGVLVEGEVPQNTVVAREYVIDNTPADGKLTIYVKTDYGQAPNLYLWYNDGQERYPNGSWAGARAENTRTVGGVEWYYKEFSDIYYPVNMIVNKDGGSQTPTIPGLSGDVFFTVEGNTPTDVTTTYIAALHNPTVDIDVASGAYKLATLNVQLNASRSDATIVYTTDGSKPTASNGTQATGTTTVKFTTAGNHVLRAAVLYNNEMINEVARTYNLSTVNATEPNTNGINFYVRTKSGNAPFIHYWEAKSGYAKTGRTDLAMPGDDPEQFGSEKRTIITDNNIVDDNWYYYHIEDATQVRFLFCADANYSHQSANQLLLNSGCYFYDYNDETGALEDLTQYFVTTTTGESQYPTTGFNFFVINAENNGDPWTHVWYGDWDNGWQLGDLVYSTDGRAWRYVHVDRDADAHVEFSANNSNTSNDYNKATNNSYFYYIYPSGSGDKRSAVTDAAMPTIDTQTLMFKDLAAGEELVEPSGIPSCATKLTDATYYLYFENSWNYANPFAWIYNGAYNYTGGSWPGARMAELVGTAANGNAVYRWAYYGEPRVGEDPTTIIFSDNGTNQSGNFEFHNGGYYTCNNYLGSVEDTQNEMTLAALISSGNATGTVTIANDLTCVYVNEAGTSIFAKDNNGESVDYTYNTDGKLMYDQIEEMQGREFDQSNWIELVMPSALTSAQAESLVGHKLLGGTMMGEINDLRNPKVTLVAMPVPGDAAAYDPNVYTLANFMKKSDFGANEEVANDNYYFVNPKANEYAKVKWVICSERDGDLATLVLPESDPANGVNQGNLKGALLVTVPAGVDIVEGMSYEDITGVITKRAAGPSDGAPRRALTPQTGVNPSGSYTMELTDASDGESVVTGIQDITAKDRRVLDVIYYNPMGVASKEPFSGINIIVTRYTDGSTSTKKVLR